MARPSLWEQIWKAGEVIGCMVHRCICILCMHTHSHRHSRHAQAQPRQASWVCTFRYVHRLCSGMPCSPYSEHTSMNKHWHAYHSYAHTCALWHLRCCLVLFACLAPCLISPAGRPRCCAPLVPQCILASTSPLWRSQGSCMTPQ